MAALAVCFSAATASAQVTVSLASPLDMNHFALGSTATIGVHVSGIAPGIRLDSLLVTATDASGLLGFSNAVAGAIVPALTEPSDFSAFATSDTADAIFFSTTASEHVVGDGAFLAFDVTALGPGSGEIAFAFASATSFDPLGPSLNLDDLVVGPPLAFTVVPEPATGSLFGLSILLVIRVVRRRAR